MIPPAYEEIGFGWNGHRAALRYLAAAYRINGFQYKLRKHYEGSKDWFTVLRGGMALWLHSLPYLAVACAAGGWVVHAALEIATTREDLDGMSSPLGVAGLVVRGFRLYTFALLGALLPGFIVRLCPRTHGRAPFDLVRSMAVGVAIAVVLGLCVGLGFSISDGLPPDYIELRFAIVIACLLFGLGCLTDARERVVLVAVCTVSGFVLGDADGGLRHRATHAVVSCFLAGAILFRFYYWPVH